MSGHLFFSLYLSSLDSSLQKASPVSIYSFILTLFFRSNRSALQKATSGKYFFRSYLPSFLDPIHLLYKKQGQVSFFSDRICLFLQKQDQVSIFLIHTYLLF